MTRAQLWELLKKHGITQSKRPDCPPDTDLGVVIRHSTVSSKALVDFICSLDGPATTKKKSVNDGLTEIL